MSKSQSFQTAAAYIRVSTDRQEELSPAAQKRELKKYAKSNNIVIVDFFQDDGISGRTAEKRPGFQKMIAAAKSPDHPFDCILIWKFSRFARNQEESIVYKSLLRKNNVDVVSITEPLIDGPFASLIERIIEWMDEYYSIRLSGDVMRGMTEKALRGGYQAAPPIGYLSNKSTGIPVINEPDACIVRYMFQSCLDGMNLLTIARTANDLGYRTKRGNPFEVRTVYYILSNPFYIGMVRWNRAKHSGYLPNDDKDIIVAPGKHEPIISKEDFDKVQLIIEKHKPGHTGQRRSKSDTLYNHYLCGFMKCPICGSNLAYNSSPSVKYPYFCCYRYTKGQHKGGGHINAKRCEDALSSSLSALIDKGAENVSFRLLPTPAVPSSSENLERYRTALANLHSKEKRIRDAYIDGIDTKEEYRQNKETLKKEQSRLESLIAQDEQLLPGIKVIQSPAEYIQAASDVLELIQSPSCDAFTKHRSLEALVDHMEYDRKSDMFQVYYKYS